MSTYRTGDAFDLCSFLSLYELKARLTSQHQLQRPSNLMHKKYKEMHRGDPH